MRNLRCLEAEPGGVFAGPAVRWRLFDAATPHEVPGWDQLASGRSFYVAADWLRFADTDLVARSQYLGLSAGRRLVAALSCHWAFDEVDVGYVAAQLRSAIMSAVDRRGCAYARRAPRVPVWRPRRA